MLEANRKNIFSLAPENWFSVIYKISGDQIQNGHIYLNLFFSYKASLDIDGKIYTVHPEMERGIRFGLLAGIYVLESDGNIIARYESTKPLNFINAIVVSFVNFEGKLTYNEKSFILKTKSFPKQQFSLLENNQEIGNLYAERKFLLRSLVADLPSNIPIEIQAFLLWIILCAWKVANEMRALLDFV